ncbi:pleckstrin homology domain-containing family N member 1 isoform X4 [Marmota monax]|uniref:pleckstrin homology domain-containing family N member 1 isoform X4 n=1 Tax=Marmota monax TaxID=9995 RepID=UPI0026F2A4D4|nr:pleckstrin homology domain-containing family N member 1 isoform X4 [Marmota monax]
MGNSHCVPQTPRRLRASFSRKPSLKGNREDTSRKLAGLFGSEAGPDGDAAADKIFYYIPGTDFPGLENQPENLEQPILSVFKKGRRKVPVRNLGKVVHYAKVQLRFQHSQDTSDCYLELFPSHLYFQAHSSAGLTFQGLLPLVELSICPLEETGEHGFQITGPLPAPLLVLCPSEDELRCWLYHLEKQMALVGGLRRCHSVPPQGPSGDELPWSLQRRLTWLRRASGRESVGSAICASRVKLQHLPSQEQWDRLLVLYPTSLAIFSEEPDGIAFKGELPLTAIHINLEEKQTRSFLISGRLIHTIRVVCASHEDHRHWLLCLQTISRQDGDPLLLNPESFPGLQGPTQVVSEAHFPLMDGPAGIQGAQRPPPTAPATPSLSPQCCPLQAALLLPSLHLWAGWAWGVAQRPQSSPRRHHTPRCMLIPTPHLPLPIAGSQASGAWMSSSVQYEAHLDQSLPAHSPWSLCLCLSLIPALDSPALLAPQLPIWSPRKEPCSPELLGDTGVPSRTGVHSPRIPLSLSPLPGKCHLALCHLPQMVTRLHLPPTRNGHGSEGWRQRGGSSSGSDGPWPGLLVRTTFVQF